jgi:hypothetical protein
LADLSDVETTLKALIVGWVYPNGTTEPSAIAGGVPVKIGRGWPTKDALQADYAAGVANISIYSQPGYPREWLLITAPATTIMGSVSGQTVTLSGSVSTPQNIAVLVGKAAYLYTVQPTDMLTSIAASLADLIPGSESTGAALTIGSGQSVQFRAGGVGQMLRELRRQERLFQVTVWCATPEQRDVVASFVDSQLAGFGNDEGLEFINLPDGSTGRLKYSRTAPTDKDEISGGFRRDLIYSVEYPTTETKPFAEVIAVETRLQDPYANTITDQFS